MHSLFDLVKFEYKKMLTRKSAVIILALVIIAALLGHILISLRGYVDGESGRETMIIDRTYARALSGRAIDAELLAEVQNAFSDIPIVEHPWQLQYTSELRPYMHIFRIIQPIYNVNFNTIQDLTTDDLQNFYNIRHEQVVSVLSNLNIGDNSKEVMIRLDSEIETPWIFEDIESYRGFFIHMYMVVYLMLFAIGVCLAPMFSTEYSTGTSQLILSSRFGKSKLIMAKFITGISFSIIFCLFLVLSTFLISSLFYGFDGANAPLQLLLTGSVYPLSLIQTAVIFSVCVLSGAVMFSAIAMFLSAKLKSAYGVVIILTVLIFIPIAFYASEENAILLNLYRLLPSTVMHFELLFSNIPYELFGLAVMPYVFLPAFYILASAVFLFFARRAFKRYQMG